MKYSGYLYPRCEVYHNDDPEIRRAVYGEILSEYYKTKREKKKALLYIISKNGLNPKLMMRLRQNVKDQKTADGRRVKEI